MINPTGMRDNIVIWQNVYISMEFMLCHRLIHLSNISLSITWPAEESKEIDDTNWTYRPDSQHPTKGILRMCRSYNSVDLHPGEKIQSTMI